MLTQQPDFQAARKYWNKLRERLRKEGSESVTNCRRLKLPAADGKSCLTDVATAETLLRLVQSVPSPRAEPIKLWLAKVGHERNVDVAAAFGRVRMRTLVPVVAADTTHGHDFARTTVAVDGPNPKQRHSAGTRHSITASHDGISLPTAPNGPPRQA